jgi:hypothetical protein
MGTNGHNNSLASVKVGTGGHGSNARVTASLVGNPSSSAKLAVATMRGSVGQAIGLAGPGAMSGKGAANSAAMPQSSQSAGSFPAQSSMNPAGRSPDSQGCTYPPLDKCYFNRSAY